MALNLTLLIVYFAVMIAIGIYCRHSAKDVDGFVLGGRSVGPWLTAFAYGTSYFSAVIFIGYAGQFGWKFGIAAFWIGIGNAVIGSLLPWLILGKRTRIMTQHLSSSTMPQFFEKRYNSNALKIVSSMIIFVFLIPYTASLYNGLSRLFGMAFNIDYSFCILIMAVMTAVYVVAGGYMATAISNFIQGIIMIGGIIAVVAAVLMSKGGLTAAISSLAAVPNDSGKVTGAFASIFGPDPLNLFFVVILTSLGTWGLPQMVQKFYAIKDTDAIKKGTIISTVFALIVAGGSYFLGGFGRLFATPEQVAANGFDSIVPTMLSDLSPILIALVVILVLAASMSTLSSLVIASSSTLTIDLIKGNLMKKMDDKKQLLSIRLLIVVFIAVSAIIALVQYKSSVTFIAQLMGISWGALAGAFLAPFLFSLFWKRTTKAACWVCFIWGVGLMLTNMLAKPILPAVLQSPINAGAVAMLGGLVIVPVVSLLTKAPDKKTVDDAFSCVKQDDDKKKNRNKPHINDPHMNKPHFGRHVTE